MGDNAAILKWLSGHDTGSSSKAIALCALGGDPVDGRFSYPHDGADFGRCHRLLQLAPEARAGLEKLGSNGGPFWQALYAKWDAITTEYEADLTAKDGRTYRLMRSILEPIEKADRGLINLGGGATMRFGGR